MSGAGGRKCVVRQSRNATQASRASLQLNSKWMRRLAVSSLTAPTAQGGCKPSALVNNHSMPTYTDGLLDAAPWTYGQAEVQPVHMPTGRDYDHRL